MYLVNGVLNVNKTVQKTVTIANATNIQDFVRRDVWLVTLVETTMRNVSAALANALERKQTSVKDV